jgi:TIR domain
VSKTQDQKGKYDIFLAHSSDDRDQLIVSLVEALRVAGTSVWYAEFAMEPGSKVPVPDDALQRFLQIAMEGCDFGCLIISPSFLNKRWPMMELDHWASQREKAKITVILHNISIKDVAGKLGRDAEYIKKSFDVVNSTDGVGPIVSTITRKVPPRVLIKFKHFLKKSGEIFVFPKMGVIGLSSNGRFFATGSVSAKLFDFSGKDVGDEYNRITEVILRQADVDNLKRKKPENQYNFELKPFSFEKDVTYIHMNHVHMHPITNGLNIGLEEIDIERCAINFGSNSFPMVVYPFYSCDSFTGALAEEVGVTSPEITEQLKLARGSWSGDWRRIIWCKDKRFVVVGDGGN